MRAGGTRTPDLDSHGTHVAGIIAANHDGVGVAGIAPNVVIRSNRYFTDCSSSGCTVADDQEKADAINAAWEEFDTDVLNHSWSRRPGSPSDAIATAIEWAVKDGRDGLGSVVVFSAGNDTADVGFPANVPEAIAVSAITKSGDLAPYSNRGPEIEITAPSSTSVFLCRGNIVTIDFMGSGGCDDGPGGDLDTTDGFGGTSAAAPQVAAAAALLISVDPSLTESQVRQRLKDAADPWGDSDKFGAGKLNVGRLFGSSDGSSNLDSCDGDNLLDSC